MKKLLSVIVSLLIIFTLIPIGAITVSAATSGTTGECTWTLNGITLTISGNGKMGDYDYWSSSPWGDSFTKVIIEDGVTSIGDYVFNGCSSLTSITIPDSVTSIGYGTFHTCSSLTSITIPDSVTSIGGSAFEGCSSLTSITIPDSVTSISRYAFSGCYSLKSVYITDIAAWCQIEFGDNYSNPMYYGDNLYVNNQPLTSLKIPDNTEILGKNVFYNCITIENVFIPKSMLLIKQDAFYNCSGIKNVYFEGTAEEWATLTILSGNDYLENATVYYNSNGIPGGITSITVSKLPQKLKYIENEENLDLSGGVLTVNYDGGATKDIDLTTLTVTGFDNSVIGKQTITVKYGDFSAEFQVEVTMKPIEFIALSKSPLKSYYTVGETLDLTGGQVFVLYESGDYKRLELTADMVSGFNSDKEGIQVLTVTYKGYTDEFVVRVYKQSTPDFNGDGEINAADLVEMKKGLLLDADNLLCDVNFDGVVNILDFISLNKQIA